VGASVHRPRQHVFWVYLASDKQVLREHSRIAGVPITAINELSTVIDPLTAFVE
jgi:hypothetical protein